MAGIGLFAAALLCLSALGEGAKPDKTGKKDLPGADIFNAATGVIRISIEIPREGMNRLRSYSWSGGGDDGRNRPVVEARVSDGARVYTNVAVHSKGAAGSFRPIDDHPGLTLNFDKFAPGQTFHGLRKISLNNSVQDQTFMTEKICRELFEAAGVPVPRADYAVVTLNGQNKGLYVLVEGYNKQFLRRYFKDTSGNLYDGGFCQDVTDRISANSGDNMEDRSDLDALVGAAATARQNNSLEGLSKVLDMDRFVSMIGMEIMQCHWDGYARSRNNYRVFHDKETGRMVFMPHGLDQMFGMPFGRGSTRDKILPSMNGFIANTVVRTTEGRQLYLSRLREMRTNLFRAEALTNRVRALEARLRPVLAETGPQMLQHHHGMVNILCDNIMERSRSLEQQLGTPPPPMKFDATGTAKIEGWTPNTHSGRALFGAPTKGGRKLLHIMANQGPCSVSWRAKAVLPPGHYRLEGLGKTREVDKEGDTGARLRISGMATNQSLRGDADWTPLSFTFEAHDASTDVEFVCELKAAQGEAWFDPATLRLRRLGDPELEAKPRTRRLK